MYNRQDLYREIFPEGSFERKGHYEDSRPNGIAVSLPGKGGSVNGIALEIEGDGKAKRYIITDDLKKLDELIDTDFHSGGSLAAASRQAGSNCVQFGHKIPRSISPGDSSRCYPFSAPLLIFGLSGMI